MLKQNRDAGRPLRIAQVSPLYESVPPQGYGGTERVVSYLTEELVRRGHQVTLFASGDSRTAAELVAPCPRSLRLDSSCIDQLAIHQVMLEQVCRQADRFDVIHFHVDYMHYPFSRRERNTHVTTLHGRLDIPELVPLYREYSEIPVVSISDAQRKPLPWVNWQGTVYHGLPPDLYSFHEGPGDYLAFLGRFSREKRVDRAIAIAERAGMKLKIAAKLDKQDLAYYKEQVEPLLRSPWVENLGEIGGHEKESFLGNARALLFPIDWPEPFGLVMIEAMACGTPVIAWGEGSVPEVMTDGVSGFVVHDLDQAVRAVQQTASMDRKRCRQVFEERFTDARMAEDYLQVYRRLAATERVRPPREVGRRVEPADGPPERPNGKAGLPTSNGLPARSPHPPAREKVRPVHER